MIVALIGLEEQAIGQKVFVAILVMSLLTTVITPIVFQNWLLRPRRQASRGPAWGTQ